MILLVVRFIYGFSLNISKRGVAIALLIVASSLPSVASSLLVVAISVAPRRAAGELLGFIGRFFRCVCMDCMGGVLES